jgi:ADP-ribose pyrophosphatase YjhB (NUDIX family)
MLGGDVPKMSINQGNDHMSDQKKIADLYQIADELRGLASAGLRWAENGYDKERYEHILKASARLVATLETGSFDEIYTQYTDNLSHVSPINCVETAVFRQEKILLIQRQDDRLWALPGGLCEIGETLAHAAERELQEEAGMLGQVSRLMGVYDSRLWPGRTRMQLYIAQFLAQTKDVPVIQAKEIDGLSPLSEILDVDFFDEDHLPELSPGHQLRIPMAFKLFRSEIPAPFFDR